MRTTRVHVIRYVITLLFLVTLEITHSTNTKDISNECRRLLRTAEDNFYVNQPHLTCNDMLLMVHGGQIHYKCDIVQEYLRNHNALYCMRHCGSFPKRFPRDFVKRDVTKRLHVTPSCIEPPVVCDPGALYRTIDGSCNNLHHPTWGMSHRAQNRIVENAYNDSKSTSRTLGCGGAQLPSGRQVSLIVHRAIGDQQFEHYRSYMMMQVGQFLAHDFILTKMFTRDNGDPLLCCTEDIGNAGCDPIAIPATDPVFPSGGCMNFARSLATVDCHNVRQQINSQTSYIDLSMVYGATQAEGTSLRSFTGGRLLESDTRLPPDYDDSSCHLDVAFSENMYCTRAGDPRVNEQPGLTSIHTLLMNEHNRIAGTLAILNPHWPDERLFQEARKILIAVWQNIVYGEYLPMLIGQTAMRQYDIHLKPCGYKDTYSPEVDGTVINSVGTGVFRFGHSLVHHEISMMNTNYQTTMYPERLSKHFFKVNLYHSQGNLGHQHLLLWTAQTKCPKMDRQVEVSVNDELFKDINDEAFDLAALNIQRARDHGNPGYNAYRKFCKLPVARHFGTGFDGLVDHQPEVATFLQKAYRCPDDIDLFTGVITETRSHNSMLGPLGRCLIATQFKRFRDGDRFFFESASGPIGFTHAQLKTIKSVRLSTLLCDNTETLKIQKNVFIRPISDAYEDAFALKNCSTLPRLDLSLWKET